jgi:hypothetical protein
MRKGRGIAGCEPMQHTHGLVFGESHVEKRYVRRDRR